jgi:hypothetical protein
VGHVSGRSAAWLALSALFRTIASAPTIKGRWNKGDASPDPLRAAGSGAAANHPTC